MLASASEAVTDGWLLGDNLIVDEAPELRDPLIDVLRCDLAERRLDLFQPLQLKPRNMSASAIFDRWPGRRTCSLL